MARDLLKQIAVLFAVVWLQLMHTLVQNGELSLAHTPADANHTRHSLH